MQSATRANATSRRNFNKCCLWQLQVDLKTYEVKGNSNSWQILKYHRSGRHSKMWFYTVLKVMQWLTSDKLVDLARHRLEVTSCKLIISLRKKTRITIRAQKPGTSFKYYSCTCRWPNHVVQLQVRQSRKVAVIDVKSSKFRNQCKK